MTYITHILRNLNKYRQREIVKQYLNNRDWGDHTLIGDRVDGVVYSSAWYDFKSHDGEIIVLPNIKNGGKLLYYPYKGIVGNKTF